MSVQRFVIVSHLNALHACFMVSMEIPFGHEKRREGKSLPNVEVILMYSVRGP